jgi:hypothetical protein
VRLRLLRFQLPLKLLQLLQLLQLLLLPQTLPLFLPGHHILWPQLERHDSDANEPMAKRRSKGLSQNG